MEKQTKVLVFATKNGRIRAKIKEHGKPAYEVSINGESWKAGKGRKYESIILQKAEKLIKRLEGELWLANFGKDVRVA